MDRLEDWSTMTMLLAGGVAQIPRGRLVDGKVPVRYFEDSGEEAHVPLADLFLDPVAVSAQAVMAISRRRRLGTLPELHGDFATALSKARFWLHLLESPYPSWWRSKYLAGKAQAAGVTLPSSTGSLVLTPRKLPLPQSYAAEVAASDGDELGASDGEELDTHAPGPRSSQPGAHTAAYQRTVRAATSKAAAKVASSRTKQVALLGSLADRMGSLVERGIEAVPDGTARQAICWRRARQGAKALRGLDADTVRDIVALDSTGTLRAVAG
ncbi:unnamed protein product [Parajaminaea phylloscopi]